MARIKFELRSNRPNKEGFCAVWMRITRKGEVKRMVVDSVSAKVDQWNTTTCRMRTADDVKLYFMQECKVSKIGQLSAEETKLYRAEVAALHPNAIVFNEVMDRKETEAKDIIAEFERKKEDWTLDMLDDKLNKRVKNGNVSMFIEEILDNLTKTNHIGASHAYKGTLSAMRRIDPKFDKKVWAEMTTRYITDCNAKFEAAGLMANTRRYYIKTLRAAYNQAIKLGETDGKTYPFGKNGFIMPANNTVKRYLSAQDINRLKSAQLDDIRLQEAVNIWLFSYYCYGMAIHDMSTLTTDNIIMKDGCRYIAYYRQKTKHNANATPIYICMDEQIERVLQWFKDNSRLYKNYLLPIIWRDHDTPKQEYYYIKSRNHNVGLMLKEAAEVLNLECNNFTSYTARHSMAMTLQKHQIRREVISAMMGHKDLTTTQIYLDSLDTTDLTAAAKVL